MNGKEYENDYKDCLREALFKIHPIEKPKLEDFIDLWQLYSAKRKDIITRAEMIEQYLYFVVKGCQKGYFEADGKEFIVAFSYPYQFTCIPESFLTQKKSVHNWECINDSTFLRIKYSDFMNFISDHNEFETLLWKKLLGTINGLVNRYHRLISMKMEERFIDLMQKSPSLLNNIPQKEIANYLNMDPTNFSKLMNRIKI